MKKLIATAVLALAIAASTHASIVTFGAVMNNDRSPEKYNEAYGTDITAATPVEISTLTNATWLYHGKVATFLEENPGVCAEFDAALAQCAMDSFLCQLPTVYSNKMEQLSASGESSFRLAIREKYGYTYAFQHTATRHSMTDADFFGYMSWREIQGVLGEIFNIGGNTKNRAERLARRYLRTHGGFVGENGRQRVQEIVFALRDAFKTPRLAGVQAWFDQYAPELGVTFDWGFPPDVEVQALMDGILDGDTTIKENSQEYWMLYWYLGEQGFKDFFARYNGDQEAE